MTQHGITRATAVGAIALSLAAAACKPKVAASDLNGVTGRNITQSIDHDKLWAKAAQGKPFVFRVFFAYEEFYEQSRRAGENEAVTAIYTYRNWLRDEAARGGLFAGPLETVSSDLGDRGRLRFPSAADSHVYTEVLRGKVKAQGKEIPVQFELGVGRAMIPGGANLDMPGPTLDYVAEGFARADVFAYNGHVWEYPTGTGPRDSVSPGSNTDRLVAKLGQLTGGARPYGLVFLNACKSEELEKLILDAMAGKSAPAEAPLLLTQRNFSKYDYFARQLSHLTRDVLGRKSLPFVMYRLMTTLEDPVAAARLKDPEAARLQKMLDPGFANGGTAGASGAATDDPEKVKDVIESYRQRFERVDAATLVVVRSVGNAGYDRAQ